MMNTNVGEVSGNPPTAYLIVNADDYGYYAGVSHGIIDGALNGVIRATGIMANSENFEEHVGWLDNVIELDTGVHLNLTHGQPLSYDMRNAIKKWDGNFPGKYQIIWEVITGRLTVECVRKEWQMQIQRCIDAGLEPIFINTHEHLHMYPALFTIIQNLADHYKIPFIRYSCPEWGQWAGAGGVVRNSLLQVMHLFNRKRVSLKTPVLLGMSDSGKLGIPYMQKCLAELQPGMIYELMCHPGHYCPDEITDKRLLSYHHWEEELALLKSETLKEMCKAARVDCVSYSDILGLRG